QQPGMRQHDNVSRINPQQVGQHLHQIALGLLFIQKPEKDRVRWTRKTANTLRMHRHSPVHYRHTARASLRMHKVFHPTIPEVFGFHFAVHWVNGFEFEGRFPFHSSLSRSPPELPSFSFRAAASFWTAGGNTMS